MMYHSNLQVEVSKKRKLASENLEQRYACTVNECDKVRCLYYILREDLEQFYDKRASRIWFYDSKVALIFHWLNL